MIKFISKYKIIFYSSNLVLIFLYLFPGSILGLFFYGNINVNPQITPDFIVSTNHFYAFLFISILGFLTFINSKNYNILSFYLIFLSLILELSHHLIPYRGFEFSDLFGNLIGVILVIISFYFFKKNENIKN